MRNAEKIKTNILRSINFFPENYAVYEITRKNMVQPYRPHTKIKHCVEKLTWKLRQKVQAH